MSGKNCTLRKRLATVISLSFERSKEWLDTLPLVRQAHRENLHASSRALTAFFLKSKSMPDIPLAKYALRRYEGVISSGPLQPRPIYEVARKGRGKQSCLT